MREDLAGLMAELEFARRANLDPEARRRYIDELKKHIPPINVLNPVVLNDRIESVSELLKCRADYRHLIDAGVSPVLAVLCFDNGTLDAPLYVKCRGIASEAGSFLMREFADKKSQLLAVTFLSKAVVHKLLELGIPERPVGPVNIVSQDGRVVRNNVFMSSIREDLLAEISVFCQRTGVTAVDLLDVGLAWCNVHNLTFYEHLDGERIQLDARLLHDSVSNAKLLGSVINRYGATNFLEQSAVILMLLKVAVVNLLGLCAKNMFTNTKFGECSCQDSGSC